jgi:hypothetical protein
LRDIAGQRNIQVYIAAFVLALATGLFYAAGADGLWTSTLCGYGSAFCEHPTWLGVAAILALLWGAFVST